jgi:hypothetical protein
MLNAVKHLYRTIGFVQLAVEMLHCVQHDNRFLETTPPKKQTAVKARCELSPAFIRV